MQSSTGSSESQESCHFREKGVFENEVTLRFDNGEELYVDTGFLKMASPVFKTMLEADFKEKRSGVIELKGKDPTDVLELLLCIHPAVLKEVSEDMAFKMTPLAEEYAISPIIKACRTKLKSILVELNEAEKSGLTHIGHSFGLSKPDKLKKMEKSHCDDLCKCLDILNVALTFSFEDIKNAALDILSNFNSIAYLGPKKQTNKRCIEKFCSLGETSKNEILRKRLKLCEEECLI